MIYRVICFIFGIYYMIKSCFKVLCFNLSPDSHIGKKVYIRRGCVISRDVTISDSCLLYRNVILGNGVKIGHFTSINQGTVVECGTIGKACSIGVDCIIGPGIHATNYITSSSLLYRDNYPPPTSHFYAK